MFVLPSNIDLLLIIVYFTNGALTRLRYSARMFSYGVDGRDKRVGGWVAVWMGGWFAGWLVGWLAS